MRLLLGAAVAAALIAAFQSREPAEAEFAIRWAPADGGPQTPAAVLELLGVSNAKQSDYEVRYFDEPPALAPPESTAVILRLRSSHDGEAEVRLKYRRATPWPVNWRCPPALQFERSEQLDITILNGDSLVRAYSYACTLEAAQPPPALHAMLKACSAIMVRYDSKRARLEEWTMPGGRVILEVSHAAKNTAAELARFRHMVHTLIVHGADPSAFSKSKLASDCPE